MRNLTITSRPFNSAADGRPLVQLSLRAGGVPFVDAYVVEASGAKEDEPFDLAAEEQAMTDGMLVAARTLALALGLTQALVDDVALDGDILIEQVDAPEWARNGATAKLDFQLTTT